MPSFEDVDRLGRSLPSVTVDEGERPAYRVGGRHFVVHRGPVLVRLCHLDRLTMQELSEVITDAWLCRAPKRLAKAYLAEPRPPSRRRSGRTRPTSTGSRT